MAAVDHTKAELRICPAPWDENKNTLRAIREQVFIIEQQVPRDIEWDDIDAQASHFLAYLGDTAVGCARITNSGKVGRMAVLADHRAKGVGTALLQAGHEHAKSLALLHTVLNAQTTALPFYLRLGYEHCGEEFVEAGIPHLPMQYRLDYRDHGSDIIHLPYPQPFDQLALAISDKAQRQLCILSPSLDHEVFGSAAMYEAASEFARRNRYTQLRILVADVRPIVQRGHPLLNLYRRLSSSVQFQVLPEHPQWNGETLLIKDSEGVLCKPDGFGADGFYKPEDRARCAKHTELFETLWQASRPHPELRSLSL